MTDDLYLTREECRLLSTRLRELASWVITELDATICRQVAYADPLDTPVRSSDDEANVFNEHASNVAHDDPSRRFRRAQIVSASSGLRAAIRS